MDERARTVHKASTHSSCCVVANGASVKGDGAGSDHDATAISCCVLADGARIEIDGAILVDEGAQWNTSQVWSNYAVASNGGFSSPASNGFNGVQNSGNAAQASAGSNPNNILWTPPGGFAYTSGVEVYITNAANKVSVNGGTLQTIAANAWVSVASGSGTLSSLKFERASTSGASFAGIRIDGKILVDPTGGIYKTLFQTWEQTKTALLNARIEGDEERISELESILIRQAVPFDRDTQYPKGTIVNIRGQLFEAIVDDADVSIADFVSSFFRVQSPEWINLDIKVSGEPLEEVSPG